MDRGQRRHDLAFDSPILCDFARVYSHPCGGKLLPSSPLPLVGCWAHQMDHLSMENKRENSQKRKLEAKFEA